MLQLGDNLSAEDVYTLALAGNVRAQQCFISMGRALGIALANLINIFNFPLYLLSGGVLAAWDLFTPVMLDEVRKRSFTFSRTNARIEKGILGERGRPVRSGVSSRASTVRRRLRQWQHSKSMYWLGLDIGTGGTRALLVDASGAVRYAFTAAHQEMAMARPLWAEQHPDDWWRAAQEAIQGVMKAANAPAESVSGIGLSGQMHGLVILDENNKVIRPALIWCDQRSQRQVDEINATVGRENVLDYTANPVLTGFTLPKLLWVRDEEPQNYQRVRHMLLPKDYIRFKLTGEYATGSFRRERHGAI